MKPYVLALLLCLCAAPRLCAQTFLQHLQQKETGKASVSVTQSQDIDQLVNSADVSGHKPAATKPAEPATRNNAAATAQKPHAAAEGSARHTAKPDNSKKEEHPANRNNIQHTAGGEARQHNTATDNANAADAPAVDMRRKLPRRSYKVNGYRVQVLAGGNSREGKIKVQQAGNDVKMAFPDLPVYVHFYSPRWICRVGNFRTYEEASRVLAQVKKMGFKQASIVSGKITVTY